MIEVLLSYRELIFVSNLIKFTGVAESAFVVQNFSQMAELLQQLQQKMEMNANTIRCSACGDRHKRIKMDRPSYAARNCKTCKIHHAAREG